MNWENQREISLKSFHQMFLLNFFTFNLTDLKNIH